MSAFIWDAPLTSQPWPLICKALYLGAVRTLGSYWVWILVVVPVFHAPELTIPQVWALRYLLYTTASFYTDRAKVAP